MSNAKVFEIEDGVLKKYLGSGGDVVIPDGVYEIGRSAFYECSPDLWFDVPENSKARKFADRYEDDRLWSDDDYNPH